MWPFNPFAPSNLNQSINPGWFDVNINFAGSPQIEKDVVEKVASYGKQLGILTEAVLVLAGNPPPKGEDPIARLKDIAARIEKLKDETKVSLGEQARVAMEKLAKESPATAQYIAAKYSNKSST